VYCPRCGTPNEAGDRYCSACGAALGRDDPAPRRASVGERIGRLVGTTRRARLATGATALAIVVAVVSFAALEPGDDGIPRDGYTLAAERICLDAKRQIFAVGQRLRARGASESAGAFARSLLSAVTGWRLGFEKMKAPRDREEEAAQLVAALREVEVRIAQLARVAGASDPRRTAASAARADEASTAVEEAVSSLGLEECARVKLGFTPDEG
jgi:hypothetical protein